VNSNGQQSLDSGIRPLWAVLASLLRSPQEPPAEEESSTEPEYRGSQVDYEDWDD
jgi:hypothetical protein